MLIVTFSPPPVASILQATIKSRPPPIRPIIFSCIYLSSDSSFHRFCSFKKILAMSFTKLKSASKYIPTYFYSRRQMEISIFLVCNLVIINLLNLLLVVWLLSLSPGLPATFMKELRGNMLVFGPFLTFFSASGEHQGISNQEIL